MNSESIRRLGDAATRIYNLATIQAGLLGNIDEADGTIVLHADEILGLETLFKLIADDAFEVLDEVAVAECRIGRRGTGGAHDARG